MRTFSLLITLLALETASAFTTRKSTSTGVWGVTKEATKPVTLQLADDASAEGLTPRQVKRAARSDKRKAMQAAKPAPVAPEPAVKAKDPVKLIIAGAPASGKGTQCELIKEKFGVVHLSTGDMLRAAVEAQTEVGILAKEFMDSGKLVPDEVMIGVVRNRQLTVGFLIDATVEAPVILVVVISCGLTQMTYSFYTTGQGPTRRGRLQETRLVARRLSSYRGSGRGTGLGWNLG
jgi:adenylate kinase